MIEAHAVSITASIASLIFISGYTLHTLHINAPKIIAAITKRQGK